ncbi:hypothetical protein CEP52_016568 [Fusarium oligoseptatum]|uniref:Uncharacterized protein n=1 Tax=Fusarium oligoseptatum TaxID=2604345 RepID=A0A428S282_9HYPO|nr:hypothetical protein CEP52_016568 [Fusarium oligoseptatum]
MPSGTSWMAHDFQFDNTLKRISLTMGVILRTTPVVLAGSLKASLNLGRYLVHHVSKLFYHIPPVVLEVLAEFSLQARLGYLQDITVDLQVGVIATVQLFDKD